MPRLWIDTLVNNDVTIATPDSKSLMTGIAAINTRVAQMTLLRTLIGLDIGRTVHDSGEGSERVAIGIGIASQEAFAADTLPDPEVETDFPTRGWVWRAHYRVFGFATDQPTIFTRRIDLDLRSMRKLENGEAFINFSLTALEGTNAPVRLLGLIRQLWLVG